MERIELTRGDTCLIRFRRIDENGDTILTRADHLYFTVKKSYKAQNPLLQKTINEMLFEDGYYHFRIDPAETNCLPYGEYVYDVEVKTSEYTQTLAKGALALTEEATWARNEV